MTDERIKKLAHSLINYSCSLKKGEKILIDVSDTDDAFVSCLIDEAYKAGGYPYLKMSRSSVLRSLLTGISEQQVNDITAWESGIMKDMDAYIAVRGGENSYEMADVPQNAKDIWTKIYFKKVHNDIRVPDTKWCVLRYPTPAFAQSAGMSTEAFEDYYFRVCNLDYSKMDKAMTDAKARLEAVDEVRIVSPNGTDLTFSVKGIGWVKCAGDMNIPDGEIYTAPVKDSACGRIVYNAPSIGQGSRFENIDLTFENGKIVKAVSNDTERLNRILDVDEGARYLGEFSLGINPYITKPLCDILFDEKISGSIHLTPGSCYDDADNGNESSLHWDLVLIQTKEYGGGEIYFDGALVRKDGIFVDDSLKCLNPDNLR